MGRGDRPKVRWKKQRQEKKQARDKRKAAEKSKARKG